MKQQNYEALDISDLAGALSHLAKTREPARQAGESPKRRAGEKIAYLGRTPRERTLPEKLTAIAEAVERQASQMGTTASLAEAAAATAADAEQGARIQEQLLAAEVTRLCHALAEAQEALREIATSRRGPWDELAD